MFSVEQRERVGTQLISRARSDIRVVAAAAIGASAGDGDRWSDLDLTFGIAKGATIDDVLTDWTRAVVADYDAVVLFDLPFQSSIYRVFLLPGALQVDLSFTPAAKFGALGPRFHLLFGEAVQRPFPSPPSPEHLFGLAVHHAVRARICIERGRLWQAEYWIHGIRDSALTLACRRRDLEVSHGRGFDRLPPDVLTPFEATLVPVLTVDALTVALAAAIECLMREAEDVVPPDGWLRRQVVELC